MKNTFLFIFCFLLAACSGVMPYKDQNLDYLYSIQKDPSAYKGAVVAFNGEVAGIRENDKSIRLILRIDTPLYYYATGKGNSLSYEMLYVLFGKEKPRVSKIARGHKVKVLARVDGYITRQDGYGNTAGVVRVRAIALADRSQDKDFHRTDPASTALYTSWKKGKLFFEESAEQVLSRVPAPPAPTEPKKEEKPLPPVKKEVLPPVPPKPEPPAGIVFDPEDPPFIIAPPPPPPVELPKPTQQEEATAPQPEQTKEEPNQAGEEAKPAQEAPEATPPAQAAGPEETAANKDLPAATPAEENPAKETADSQKENAAQPAPSPKTEEAEPASSAPPPGNTSPENA